MPRLIKIPPELLLLNPHLNTRELRAIVMVILNGKSRILSQSSVIYIKMPRFGTIKSHGNKKKRGLKQVLAKDRRRKRILKRTNDLKPNNLLF